MINVAKTDLPTLREYNSYLKKIWKSRWLTNNGTLFQELQEKLKKYLGVKYILPVSNGTLAIQLAIKALDLKGEIITTPFTFAASTTSIIWENCTPVFADIDPETFNIDPDSIESKITKRTSAILAVHVYGNPCNVEKINKIAKKYNIKVIYDAAHAFGVKYKNRSVLNYGDISTLSFHATKTFHTIEGGAIVTKNQVIFEKLKLLINFGIRSEEKIILPGINAKMNEFQAAMGLCNLKRVDSRIRKRKLLYSKYEKLLGHKLRFHKVDSSRHNYTYLPVLFEYRDVRDNMYNILIKNGIKPRKYFFPLTCDTDMYKHKDNHSLPIAKKISDCILCLPLYSTLKISDVKKISKVILENLSTIKK